MLSCCCHVTKQQRLLQVHFLQTSSNYRFVNPFTIASFIKNGITDILGSNVVYVLMWYMTIVFMTATSGILAPVAGNLKTNELNTNGFLTD